jgi:eukaryotic-like serine/threonine-protein kinase
MEGPWWQTQPARGRPRPLDRDRAARPPGHLLVGSGGEGAIAPLSETPLSATPLSATPLSATPLSATLHPGQTLLNGQYRIVRRLGHGGFASVYLAEATHLGEQVAIKELHAGLAGAEAAAEGESPADEGAEPVLSAAVLSAGSRRFLAEAKATMRLSHDRIVRTHHVFREAGRDYIVMEHVAGGSLEDRLQAEGRLAVDEALHLAAQICEGLHYAHQRGVIHNDLKPGNVLFDARGTAKIADFGVAHLSAEVISRSWATPAGFVAGTLPYMSPEQTAGVRDDPRVDIYALGALLYRVLTGRHYLPFQQEDTPAAIAENVLRIHNERPRPPSAHNRRVPRWLDRVVLTALAKKPEDRYASAEALRAALTAKRVGYNALSAPEDPEDPTGFPKPKPSIPRPGSSGTAGNALSRLGRTVAVVLLAALFITAFEVALDLRRGADSPLIFPPSSFRLQRPSPLPTQWAGALATGTPSTQPTPGPGWVQGPPLSPLPEGGRPGDTLYPNADVVPNAPTLQPATAQPRVTTGGLIPGPATAPLPAAWPAPALLFPEAEAELRGRQRFAWSGDLPPDGLYPTRVADNASCFFDLRIWSQQEEVSNVEPRGAVELTRRNEVEIDLAAVPAIRQYGPGAYYWTVVVVEGGPQPRVVGAWGEERSFRYLGP